MGKINVVYVLYTDGSFKRLSLDNNIGHRGCGIHGYVYKEGEVIDKPQTDLPPRVFTTTEGYNSKPGELVKPIAYYDQVVSCANLGTNITAELEAVIFSLTTILASLPDEYNLTKVHLWTDSNYVIQITENLKNPSYAPKANEELVNRYKELLDTSFKDIELILHKSEAHTGEFGNELVDKLARVGRELSIKHVYGNWSKHNLKSYWKNTIRIHPLLNFKQLCFTNTQSAQADEILYHVMDYGKDVDPGKKTSKTCFGLIRLEEQEELISKTISSFLQACYAEKYFCAVNMLNLSTLYSRNTATYWDFLGEYSLVFNPKEKTLSNVMETVVARPIVPSGLAEQALERMKELYTIMRDFGYKQEIFKFIDITDKFYNLDGKWILPKDTEKLQIEVEVLKKKATVTMELGVDLLSYNSLKNLTKEHPTIWLVLKPDDYQILNFYTIVKTASGIGVYTNFYTSKVYLN